MTLADEFREHHLFVNSAEIQKHRGWFIFLGGVMVLLGIAALLFPFAATLAGELALGVILLVAGIIGTVHALQVRPWKGFWLSLLTALLTVIIGGLLVAFPMHGIMTVTLLITAMFLVSGVFRTILAFQLKPYDAWGWILASGILALILGILVITQLPEAAFWLIGILVGVDFLFAGWAMISLVLSVPGR
ncbi:HdeD family acid-resistance protein [Thiohalophilus sp.]|uniref:HdeD family acid-resistance protein n=1 Tax=Thiohalophilus sp. TaxID=3028392 RepID=UPI003976A32C